MLAWPAIPAFITSFYATSDRLLIIGGTANIALILTSSSFAALAVLPFGLAPLLGVAAIPAAMIFSAVFFNPLVAMRVARTFSIRTIAGQDLLAMIVGAAALAAYAVMPTLAMQLMACAVVGGIAIHYGLAAMNRSPARGDDALATS